MMLFREYLRDLCVSDFLTGRLAWSISDLDMREDALSKICETVAAMKKYAEESKGCEKAVIDLLHNDDDEVDWHWHASSRSEKGLAIRMPASQADTDDAGSSDFTFDQLRRQKKLASA